MKKTQTVKFNSLKTLALVAAGGLATQLASGQCVPPPPGLVAWWPGDGNANDIAQTNNGVLLDGATFAPGIIGQAFSFSYGATVTFPTLTNLEPAVGITMMAWVKAASQQAAYAGLMTKMDSGYDTSHRTGFKMGFSGGGNTLRADFGRGSGGAGDSIMAGNSRTIADGEWHLVVATYDGISAVMYVDAIPGNPTVASGYLTSNTRTVLLGNDDNAVSRYFTGQIDEPAILSRALSSNEIAAIYAAGSAGMCKLHIVMQPQSQVSYWGKSVTFSVTATSSAVPLSYQWSMDDSPVPGATNATLILSNLQATNAGTYSVLVSDSAGNTVTSQTATLTVNPAGVAIALYAGVTIDGVVGQTYGIQSTLDLSNTNSWVGRTNITLTTSTFLWYDSQPATQPQTYYRVVPGPISVP
jgi:hypothetical protein